MLLGLTHAGVARFDGYTGTPFTMAERCQCRQLVNVLRAAT